MRAGCPHAELLRDPSHGSHGALPPSQGPGASRRARGEFHRWHNLVVDTLQSHHPPRISWPTRAQPMPHPSNSLQSAKLTLHPSKSLHIAQPTLNPSWSFHNAPRPQVVISLHVPRMVRINQVVPTIPLTRIGATSERRERYGDGGAMEPAAIGRSAGDPT